MGNVNEMTRKKMKKGRKKQLANSENLLFKIFRKIVRPESTSFTSPHWILVTKCTNRYEWTWLVFYQR